MATKMNTKMHFTHPNHLLFEFPSDQSYRCNACFTQGIGKRFRCDGCNFDLHEFCANCPHNMSSFMHRHDLNLLIRKVPEPSHHHIPVSVACNFCHESINDNALFYSCSENCGFHIHPLCTQLPDKLRHVIDNHHSLSLCCRSSGVCSFCNSMCHSWRYACEICHVDIHSRCLTKPFNSPSTQSPSGHGSSSSRGIGFASAPSPWSMIMHNRVPYYNGYWVPQAYPYRFMPHSSHHHGNNQHGHGGPFGSSSSIMVCTRPDLAHPMSVVSRFMTNPRKHHWKSVKWILRYLKGTISGRLVYGGDEKNEGAEILGFVDADYTADIDKRRSLTGFVYQVFGSTVSWKSSLQHIVALSTTESEYIALVDAVKERI